VKKTKIRLKQTPRFLLVFVTRIGFGGVIQLGRAGLVSDSEALFRGKSTIQISCADRLKAGTRTFAAFARIA